MVLLTLQVDIKDQAQLDAVLRSLLLVNFKHGSCDVYEMKHLSPGLILTAGKPAAIRVPKRTNLRNSLATFRPQKKVKASADQVRGLLLNDTQTRTGNFMLVKCLKVRPHTLTQSGYAAVI